MTGPGRPRSCLHPFVLRRQGGGLGVGLNHLCPGSALGGLANHEDLGPAFSYRRSLRSGVDRTQRHWLEVRRSDFASPGGAVAYISIFTPPLSGGIGSRQQKQRLRAPRRRFFCAPPSLGWIGSKKGIKRPPRALSRARRNGRKARRLGCRGTLRREGHLACGSPPSSSTRRCTGRLGRAPHQWG